MKEQLLEGKVVIVTGASSGLGLVFAEEIAKEGAAVVMTGRDRQKLQEAAAGLTEKGLEVFPVEADVADKEDTANLFRQVLDKYGKFDAILTNAARKSNCSSVEVADDDYIDSIVDTNIKGAIRYNREAMKHFLERGKGVILNIGSNNVGRPISDAVYCASKYALWGLTRHEAIRTVGTGIRVNLLNPGSFPTQTSLGANADADHMYDADILVRVSGVLPVPNGSMTEIMKAKTNRAVPVDLKQVAYAAIYLISDLARDVTGQVFTVDRGGYM